MASDAELQEALMAVGRKQLECERRASAYSHLLTVLANVISGEIDASRVAVNLTAESWDIAVIGEVPSTPATVNGLPVVVVGKSPVSQLIDSLPPPAPAS
jgi:hypothetical protein